MSVMFRFKLLAICTGCLFSVGLGQRVLADETNTTTVSPRQAGDKITQDSLNAFLQIQEQLHATQLLIESNRAAAAAEAQRDTAGLNARLQLLEQSVATQHASENEAVQKAQRLTLILAGAFVVVGLTAMFFMAYFQWRTITRLVELSALRPSALALDDGNAAALLPAGDVHAAPGRAAVQLANARLFHVVERLEKRILELEHTAQAPLMETVSPAADGPNGALPASASPSRDTKVASLLAEGQLLLNDNEPEKALARFDEALALDPKRADTLIKKADALEKLDRFEEAIVCYDDAIAADNSMTIAYLHKGGLFNRMSRYEEALQCYEHALHTHDQRATGEKTAA